MDKVSEIINVAQELFGKYGFAKTTMTDIANRLEMSKASLYYYYPDKESIYLVVISREQESFINFLNEFILKTDDPIDILYQYVQIRLKYFSNMLNLNRESIEDNKGLKSEITKSWAQFREKEEIEIKLILEKGINKGVFKIDKLDEMVSLFLAAFKGLVFYYLRNKDLIFLHENDYKLLEEELTLFTSIFIKGIDKTI